MRELRRILDANAGRSLEFYIGKGSFLISSLVEDEGKIRIESGYSSDLLVTAKWSELADFINDRIGFGVEVNKGLLYSFVLEEVILEFLAQPIKDESIRKELRATMSLLIEEEPVLKGIISLI